MKRPVLITLTHASNLIPSDLRQRLNLSAFELKYKTDPATEKVFGVKNAHIIVAKFSRIIGNPNGDPADFNEKNPDRNGAVSLRPFRGKSVLKKNPQQQEVAIWRKKFVDPFYARIENVLPHVKFLLDGHSHFSRDRDTGEPRTDIIISNRNFQTCGKILTTKIANFFNQKGFSVAINQPFIGGYIINKYCSKKSPPGIQLEIKRSLYLDEKTLRVRPRDVTKLHKVIAELVEMLALKNLIS
ncbi:MAG: N-formylglutamate amidohydrolase [Patescibacteria group bacterium]